jgi:hypothetical protein
MGAVVPEIHLSTYSPKAVFLARGLATEKFSEREAKDMRTST